MTIIYNGKEVEPISDEGLERVTARDGSGCEDATVRAIIARLQRAEASNEIGSTIIEGYRKLLAECITHLEGVPMSLRARSTGALVDHLKRLLGMVIVSPSKAEAPERLP